MYDNEQFAEGVHSTLLAAWTVRCETPLAVRNGIKLSYSSDSVKKSRGHNLRLRWEADADQAHEVAALYYGYAVEQNRVIPYHFVPSSTIRGALRSWTIRQFVHPSFLQRLTPPPQEKRDETSAYIANINQALQKRSNGYELIASLFGLAADTREDNQLPSNAGRLQVETDPFERSDQRQVDASASTMQVAAGPANVKRHMTVRNPLDRLTHASRDGGLHQFLEFARGETFRVRLSILNPSASDIALLGLWVREIEYGLLRFGALSSIGRGRVSLTSQKYDLWRRPNAPERMELELFQEHSEDEDDALSSLWRHYTISTDALSRFESTLLHYAGEASHA